MRGPRILGFDDVTLVAQVADPTGYVLHPVMGKPPDFLLALWPILQRFKD
jgi:hypothetical protein